MSLDLLVPWAARQSSLSVLACMLGDLMLWGVVRHHHIRLGCHGLVRCLSMLAIRRRRCLLRHGPILRLRRVVHRLLRHLLRRRLAIHAPLVIVTRGRRDGRRRVGLRRLVNRGVLSMHRGGHHVWRILDYLVSWRVLIDVQTGFS